MPTNRTPRRRDYRPPITPEAREMWRQIRALERQGEDGSQEYKNLGRKLCGLVGCDWCSMMWPSTVTSVMPDHVRHNEVQAEAYRQAWAARCALIEAAGE